MLDGIATIGQTKSESEVETLYQIVLEEMSLDHGEIRHRLIANYEFDPSNRRSSLLFSCLEMTFREIFIYVAPIVLRRRKSAEKL